MSNTPILANFHRIEAARRDPIRRKRDEEDAARHLEICQMLELDEQRLNGIFVAVVRFFYDSTREQLNSVLALWNDSRSVDVVALSRALGACELIGVPNPSPEDAGIFCNGVRNFVWFALHAEGRLE
jgi:hypothetical protein